MEENYISSIYGQDLHDKRLDRNHVFGSLISISGICPNLPFDDIEEYVEPDQNLNGYDYPWVGGAGKNLFNSNDPNMITEAYISKSPAGVFTKDEGLSTRLVYITCKPSTSYTISDRYSTNLRLASFTSIPEIDGTASTSYNIPDGITPAGTGLVITTGPSDTCLVVQLFSEDDVEADFDNLIYGLMIEEGTTVSPWEPYENICRIYGADDMEIKILSKNIFYTDNTFYMRYDPDYYDVVYNQEILTIDKIQEGSIDFPYFRMFDMQENVSYRISYSSINGGKLSLYNRDILIQDNIQSGYNFITVGTQESAGYKLVFEITDNTLEISQLMISPSQTSEEYEQHFDEKSIYIETDNKVYTGVFDTQDRVAYCRDVLIDLSTLETEWNYDSSLNLWNNIYRSKKLKSNPDIYDLLCDSYRIFDYSDLVSNPGLVGIALGNSDFNSNTIYCRTPSSSTYPNGHLLVPVENTFTEPITRFESSTPIPNCTNILYEYEYSSAVLNVGYYKESDVINVITNQTKDISSKADINSPTFTGVPTAPTAARGTNTAQIATTEFVQGEIAQTSNVLVIGMNMLADAAWSAVNTAYTSGKAIFAYTYSNYPVLYEMVDCYEDRMIGYEEKDFIFRSITASNASGASISTKFLKRIGNGVSYEYEWSDGTVSLAPQASPTFTGIPTAPTAAPGTNTTQIATTAFVKSAIDSSINNAIGGSY